MAEPKTMVIETRGLTRYFGARCIVSELSLQIPRGCVFGFLGRNGAGKSTTIRMLTGLVRPTRGSATLLGEDCTRLTPGVRARVGYLAEGHPVPGWMTAADAERFQSGSYAHWNHELFGTVVGHFRLRSGVRAREMSRGQRAGLCLALTLAPEPEVLILDDPALGLDAVARRSLLEAMIYATRRSGQTILFSSHILSDVERVADRIAVIDEGVLRAECSVATFQERVRRVALTFSGAPPGLAEVAGDMPGLLSSVEMGREMVVTVANYDERVEDALLRLRPARLEVTPLSLEEAFVDYVGRQGTRSLLAAASAAGGGTLTQGTGANREGTRR